MSLSHRWSNLKNNFKNRMRIEKLFSDTILDNITVILLTGWIIYIIGGLL